MNIMSPIEKNKLKAIVSKTPVGHIYPKEFFLAHSGVFTLAFYQFPMSIKKLKDRLEKNVTGLKREDPGSRWPKVTLGCLKDGKNLDIESVYQLKDICDHYSPRIQKSARFFIIDRLEYVLYLCRSLEKRLVTIKMQLSCTEDSVEKLPVEKASADVEQIMSQFNRENINSYLPKLTGGTNTESHYRDAASGSTLVYDLPLEQPAYIQDFISDVDAGFPDLFCWFHTQSRHITIRSLY